MSKKLFLIGLISVLAIALIIVSCERNQKNPVAPIQPTAKIQGVDETNPLGGQAGTTLTATVTCEPHYTLEYPWTISKSVTPTTWDLFKGDEGTSEYTVTVTKGEGTYKAWFTGKVCVTNGGAVATEGLEIVVQLTDPSGKNIYNSAPVDVSSNTVLDPIETGCYDYSISIPAANITPGATYKVTANVTITNHSGHLGEKFGPSPSCTSVLDPAILVTVNDCIHVTDTFGGPWGPVCETTTFDPYSKTFTETGTYKNTATITETKQTADATVTVKVWELEVTKDATTTYDRNWSWTVDKYADKSSLTLATGEQIQVNYTVAFTRTYNDGNFAVTGNITVHNPAPMAATINGLLDEISTGIAADVTCSVDFPYSLASLGDLKCTYSADLPNKDSRTNTATVTLQNYSYNKDKVGTVSGTTDFTGSYPVTFNGPTNEYDECVTVDDDYEGSTVTGTICANQTFTYSPWIGPYEACGEYTVENTASFVTNDNGVTGSDSWTVDVSVPCAGGCTLTPGYWKTHSHHGPAPEDDAWFLLGDKDGDALSEGADETFFYPKNNQTYYQVLWTPPAGGNAYYILAHQYIAAKLNILNGASSTPPVDAALVWATNFFNAYTPTDKLSKIVSQQAKSYSDLLDQYNNGLIGPGHCSE